jgi:hypothetical protein
MSTAAVAVAAANARARRRILEALREQGALSPSSAGGLDQTDGLRQRMLSRLLRDGVVVQPEPDRFYLDEARLAEWEAAWRKRRTQVLTVVLGALVLLALGVLLFTTPR